MGDLVLRSKRAVHVAWLLSAAALAGSSCEPGTKSTRVDEPVCGNGELEYSESDPRKNEQCEQDDDCFSSSGTMVCVRCECQEDPCGDGQVTDREMCDFNAIPTGCDRGQVCDDECVCVDPAPGEGGMGGQSPGGEGAQGPQPTAGETQGGTSNGGTAGNAGSTSGGSTSGSSSGGSGGSGGATGCSTAFPSSVYFVDEATAEARVGGFGAAAPDYLQVWFPYGEVGPAEHALTLVDNAADCVDQPCALLLQDVDSQTGLAAQTFLCTEGTVSMLADDGPPGAGARVACQKFEPIELGASDEITVLTTPGCRKLSPLDLGGCEVFEDGGSFSLHDAPEDMVAADLDDDGHNDIVIVGGDRLVVHFGSAQGTFSAGTPLQIAVPSEDWLLPQRVVAMDINGDFIDDVAVVGPSSSPTPTSFLHVGTVLGNTDSSAIVAGAAVATPAYSQETMVVELQSADLNADGDDDLVFAARATVSSPDRIIVFLNTGNALGTPANLSVQPYSGLSALIPGAVTPGAGLDLITLNRDSGSIALFPGTSGVYDYQQHTDSNVPSGAHAMTALSFNDDAIPDVALAITPQFGLPDVRIYTGGSSGNYGLAGTAFSDLTLDSLAAADFDGNGAADLVLAMPIGPQAFVRFNDGEGNFSSSAPFFFPSAGGQRVTVADVNGDGHPDVLQTDGESARVLMNRAQSCPAPD